SLYEIVQKLHTLHLLLDAAKYKEFWQSINDDEFYADLIADCIGFKDTIRVGISQIISQTMKEVKRDILESWINLDYKAFITWVQDVFHWEILGDIVKLPENKDNVSKLYFEKIFQKFLQLRFKYEFTPFYLIRITDERFVVINLEKVKLII
ncbi:hypothetical protein PCK2_000809, partial [Pneumocystis canis]